MNSLVIEDSAAGQAQSLPGADGTRNRGTFQIYYAMLSKTSADMNRLSYADLRLEL
jgi:hypothetical protein